MKAPSIVVLVSGNGSNLQALIDACERGDLHARIAAVVSNRPRAYGLTRAREKRIPTAVLSLRDFDDRAAYDDALADLVGSWRPDLVVLAGFMLILGPRFLDRFPRRVVNLHPALPGVFPGVKAIERAHAAGERGELDETGVMVHFVVPEVDAGPVILTRRVPLRPGEPLEALAARMHAAEHEVIVEATAIALKSSDEEER